ncbi:MAG: hypothetical protein U1B84_33860, partial [Variovorax sp.]|nr:hypothetical protein [Variovorax sp.]
MSLSSAAQPSTPAATGARLESLTDWPLTERLPVLFLGHGSPMNAIEDNVIYRVPSNFPGAGRRVYPG